MLRYLTISLLILFSITVGAQPYGNEWIDDYSKSYFKIEVTQNGLYRIPYSTLSNPAYGIDLNTIQGNDFVLYRNGEKTPIYVSNQGSFSSSDFIEFYGTRNNGELDKQLYLDESWQAQDKISMFTDTAVYFLTWDQINTNPIIQDEVNNISNPPAKEQWFMDSLFYTYPSAHYLGDPTYLGTDPVYSANWGIGEGWADQNQFTINAAQSYTITTNSVYTSAPVSALIEPIVLGLSNTPHDIEVEFNSNSVVTDQFTGYALKNYSFNVNPANLNTSNTLKFSASGTGSVDRNSVVGVNVKWPREYKFNNASSYRFEVDGFGAKYLELQNFNDKGTNPILYDLTNLRRLVDNFGSTTHKFHLNYFSSEPSRNIVVSSQSSDDIRTITQMERKTFRNFNDPDKQGSYIIITHPSLLDDGNGNNWVEEYRKLRDVDNGGEYEAIVVLINELYDQFAYGTQKHPLAIRNFIRFAIDNFAFVQPEYLFLIGKGREYKDVRYNQTARNQCLIPTWGMPGSDNLLTADLNSIVPSVPTGRLSVTSGDEVKIYYDKMVQFEQHQREVGGFYQTISRKLWMKNMLHLGGGQGASQQANIKNYLFSYENTAEDTSFGAHIKSFYKTSTAPIQIAQSEALNALIDSGLSLITFFGHSSPNSFDFNLDDPANYTNYGKYPFVMSNGCFAGNIYKDINLPDGIGLSEQFVLEPDKGAIAFLATISLSAESGLNTFASGFYQGISHKTYGQPVGDAIKYAVQNVEDNFGSLFNIFIAEEMTLHGDPALKLNPHAAPDYVIEPRMVSFDPPVLNVGLDSFTVRVISSNIGRAIYDTMKVTLIREMPNGTTIPYVREIVATYYQDTLDFRIPMQSSDAFGLNSFCVTLDTEDEIPNEISEMNNGVCIDQFVLSDDIFPIWPYEFAIVNEPSTTLYASTANPFADVKTYVVEIDTTELFNSSLKQSQQITQSGGVIEWTPPITFSDSIVYYWRVGVDTTVHPGSLGGYHNSSFIYLSNTSPGWNQSHLYQYLKDDFSNTLIDQNRDLQFEDNLQEVIVNTAIYPNLPYEQISYSINNVQRHSVVCAGVAPYGITVAVLDPVTGEPWQSKLADVSGNINTLYGNIHCKQRDLNAFYFFTNNTSNRQLLTDFLNNVPNGHYIVAYSVNNPQYNSWEPSLVQAFQNLGSSKVDSLNNEPWVFFVKKGDLSSVKEQKAASNNDIIFNFKASITVNWNAGDVESTLIGPAFSWGHLYLDYYTLDNPDFDITSVDVIGVESNGVESTLISEGKFTDTTLSFIDASTYPWIRLRYNVLDDSSRTPAQLEYWRVIYDKVPEAALNPSRHFVFEGDSLLEGETFHLEVAVENVSNIDMDSLLIAYTVTNKKNVSFKTYLREDSLKQKDWMIASFDYQTDCNCADGLNRLLMEINPEEDQPEQFHFNNIGLLGFRVAGDNENPLLDVTFDGNHILDGDIVSPYPEILITLKDENVFLALDDTSLLNIFLMYPDGTERRMSFDDDAIEFIPADANNLQKNNRARVIMHPEFPVDGIYELLIQAEDKSRNISGTFGDPNGGYDYRVSFEVINKPSITNVMNYPNPFTTATHFVFTLTGSTVPDFFKIQIMTVTGRIVKEIMRDELGPLNIGRNITEYAWDGTDMYGDRLANGLYLYRVVTSINGQELELRDSGADKWFEKGFGKMYLVR